MREGKQVLLYAAVVRKDGDTFVVMFPDIPHAHTNGSSRDDAIRHAPDALQAGISMLMEKGEDIPLAGKIAQGMDSRRAAFGGVFRKGRTLLCSALLYSAGAARVRSALRRPMSKRATG